MRHHVPKDSDFIATSPYYKGFRLAEPIEPLSSSLWSIEPSGLRLVYPESPIPNTHRRVLSNGHIMPGIGITALFEEKPEIIPPECFALVDDEPVKIMTSTVLLSEHDGRLYIAYFYFDAEKKLIRSFVAQKPWASACPSLIVV